MLLYLDPYHLGDPLFLTAFARDVQAHRGPLLLAHGGGEDAERALEAAGHVPRRESGRLVVDDLQAAARVERAVRDLNRRIVHELNEVGVAALRITGTDRALLRLGEGGGVAAGRVGWLAALLAQRVVPVVGLLAEGDGRVEEAAPGAALVALARALAEDADGRDVAVGFLTRGRRTPDESEDLSAFSAAVLPAFDVARHVASEAVRVRLIDSGALRS